jgi:hypothetical protein
MPLKHEGVPVQEEVLGRVVMDGEELVDWI